MDIQKKCIDAQFKEGIGLALSGGGFRASLFHIGVLARLAECDKLKEIDAISTVSGGSIIGAQYYLHLKNLLESKKDTEIVAQDYVDIVKTIETSFLASVQKNIRMRTFLDMEKNIQMYRDDYSRSDRLGELYDEYFYQGILNNRQATGMIQMRELLIHPKGFTGKKAFHPMRNNGPRKHKVPVLLINATTLNDGHNWVFEARTMGEPHQASALSKDLDKNWRLCRPDEYDNTQGQQDVELGMAVAASACVPGIFPPLAISGLYEKNVRVQLVDGGVHDNQGIKSLMDRGCTKFIVSDASGQMGNEADPSTNMVKVYARVNGILMDRVREEQLLRAKEDYPMNLMHLRRDLPPQTVNWFDKDGRPQCQCKGDEPKDPTTYGVPAKVQDLLSKVRTDLDSFHDVEAYSLMLDGYRMTAKEYESEGCTPPGPEGGWKFREMEQRMDGAGPAYIKLLKVSSNTFLKALFLSRKLQVIAGIIGVLVLFGLYCFFKAAWGYPLYTITTIDLLVVLVAVIFFALPKLGRTFKAIERYLRPFKVARRWLIQLAIAGAGALFVRFYLKWIDPIYLEHGE